MCVCVPADFLRTWERRVTPFITAELQRGQLGDTLIFMLVSISLHAVHFWCLTKPGHDTYPHGPARIISLCCRMPLRWSGIHGAKHSCYFRYRNHHRHLYVSFNNNPPHFPLFCFPSPTSISVIQRGSRKLQSMALWWPCGVAGQELETAGCRAGTPRALSLYRLSGTIAGNCCMTTACAARFGA